VGTPAPQHPASTPSFNFADLWEAVSDRVAEREAVVCGERRVTYAELEEGANRLAHHLASSGVAPGDFVGCHLTNRIEHLESLLACWKLRAVPVNINFRYVADELRHLFVDAGLVAVVTEVDLAERVAEVRGDAPALRHVLVVGDGYREALGDFSPVRPDVAGRGDDDLYVIYTGGTTGLPKGVVWRMGDAFFGCLGGGDPMRMSGLVSNPEEVLERIIDFDFVYLTLAPLMHAAAQWVSMMWLLCGAKVVLHQGAFDPLEIWRTVEREHVSTTTVVGDAMARPLCDAWDRHGPFDVSSLFAFSNGGAPLTASTKARLLDMLPGVVLTDGFGSSETGIQGSTRVQVGEQVGGTARFESLAGGTVVLDEHGRPVEAGSGQVGWLAHHGHIPLRYHNAPDKTAETFLEVDDVRYVRSGDMATVDADGTLHLLGRGSVCINTGGEKVFPEEVEAALKAHPAVYDAVVVGVPDERWGEQVAAVVRVTGGHGVPSLEELAEHCRGHLAGYKVPRRLCIVEEVVRSPAGKADYRWAKQVAEQGDGGREARATVDR
jgi:acyl-CoA synthetase (AMP-forming)/AMP-acid ligase II